MKQKIFTTDRIAEMAKDLDDSVSLYSKDSYDIGSNGIIEVTSNSILSRDSITQIEGFASADCDFEAARVLYEFLKDMNNLQATDPRFWTYLAHADLWRYMQKRWNAQKSSKYIKNHWFLLSRSQQPLLRHGLSGLWWSVKFSIRPEDPDPYRLTKLFFRDQDARTRTFGTYRLGRLNEAIGGIFGYIHDNIDIFDKKFEDKVRFVAKHFNKVGGTKQLAYMGESYYFDEMDKIKDKILEII